MKKKIVSIIGSIAIIAVMVFNTQFTNNVNRGSSFTLSSIVMQAFASDGESGGVINEICTSTTACGNSINGLPLKTRESTSNGDKCCMEESATNRGCIKI